MKIGTFLERIFKATGIKWLVEKIVVDLLGFETCGCERRRDKLDNLTIKRK
jgi:hypothetical protein